MIDDVAGHDKHLSEFPVPLLPRPREQSVHRNLLKLAFRVLVEAANADVADALTVQGVLLRAMCQEEIYDP